MNPGLVIKLRPAGPWRIGPDSGARNRVDAIYHSDSLYSAITSAMARLGLLDEWLDSTARSATPAVCFSSCYPFQDDVVFVVPPRTIWPPTSPAMLSSPVRWKSARFVPIGIVGSILAGKRLDDRQWTLDGASECLVPTGRPGPFRTGVRWSAAVDRLTGATERHSTACMEFRPGAGLWTVAGFASEAAHTRWLDPVKAAFRLLADTGFGGERSRGWGRSETPEFIEGSLPDMILPPVEKPATAAVRAASPVLPASAPEKEPEPKKVPEAAAAEPQAAPEAPAAEVAVPGAPTAEAVEPEVPAVAAVDAALEAPSAEVAVPETPAAKAVEPEVPAVAAVDAALEAPSAEVAVPETPAAKAVEPEVPAVAAVDAALEAPSAEVAVPEAPAAEAVEPEVPAVAAVDAALEAPSAEVAVPGAPAADAVEPEVPAVAAVDAALEAPSAEVAVPEAPTAEALEPEVPAVEAVPEAPAAGGIESEAPSAQTVEPEVAAPEAPAVVAAAPAVPPAEVVAAVETVPEAPLEIVHVTPQPALKTHPHWLLSLFAPAAADRVDWARGNYTVVARAGRVDSPAGSGELKKQLQMVSEGSVVYAAEAPCGAAPDVAPDGFAHPVFRAGFALSIRLPEVS